MNDSLVFETITPLDGSFYIVALDPLDSDRSVAIERISRYTWKIDLDDTGADFHTTRYRDSKAKVMTIARSFLLSHRVAPE